MHVLENSERPSRREWSGRGLTSVTDQGESAAEKKLKEQLEKAREREQQKNNLKSVKLAEGILAKVEPVITSLSATLEHEQIHKLDNSVCQPVRDSLTELSDAAGLARKTIKDGRCREELPSIKDISQTIAMANKSKAMLTQMLAMLVRQAAR